MLIFKKIAHIRIARYIASGILSFIVEYGVFLVLFYLLGLEVKISNILSVSVALLVNFFVSKNYVFVSNSYSKKTSHQFLAYVALVLTNVTLSTVVVSFLVHHNIAGYIAKPIVMVLIAGWTYIIYKKVIFKVINQI